jgi:triosephosphate isomerase
MRTPIIAGNWKLNKTIAEARSFVSELKPLVADTSNVDVVLVPPFTALSAAAEAAQGTNISIAAQDMYWKDSGAYTGEISAPMLLDAGCKYVVLGHSERRGRFGVPEPDLEGQAATCLATATNRSTRSCTPRCSTASFRLCAWAKL